MLDREIISLFWGLYSHMLRGKLKSPSNEHKLIIVGQLPGIHAYVHVRVVPLPFYSRLPFFAIDPIAL